MECHQPTKAPFGYLLPTPFPASFWFPMASSSFQSCPHLPCNLFGLGLCYFLDSSPCSCHVSPFYDSEQLGFLDFFDLESWHLPLCLWNSFLGSALVSTQRGHQQRALFTYGMCLIQVQAPRQCLVSGGHHCHDDGHVAFLAGPSLSHLFNWHLRWPWNCSWKTHYYRERKGWGPSSCIWIPILWFCQALSYLILSPLGGPQWLSTIGILRPIFFWEVWIPLSLAFDSKTPWWLCKVSLDMCTQTSLLPSFAWGGVWPWSGGSPAFPAPFLFLSTKSLSKILASLIPSGCMLLGEPGLPHHLILGWFLPLFISVLLCASWTSILDQTPFLYPQWRLSVSGPEHLSLWGVMNAVWIKPCIHSYLYFSSFSPIFSLPLFLSCTLSLSFCLRYNLSYVISSNITSIKNRS